MNDQTPNLALPYILPSQAQKHVTHNEALQMLDGSVHPAVVSTLAAPPASPGEGAIYRVSASASGAWSGRDGKLAMFIDGAWSFLTPRSGWTAWFVETGTLLVFDGTDWIDPLATGALTMLGVNATPDATNRFALSSDASLFSHAGSSHRVKLNKATATDTGSLLFQTGWSGRAEIGLTGSDRLQFKTSEDGTDWFVGLEVDGSGRVRMPARPLVSAILDQGTITPASGDAVGFDTLSLSQGGFALGASLASGFGKELTVPASGNYALSLAAFLHAGTAFELALTVNGAAAPLLVGSGSATSGTSSWNANALLPLEADDTLALTITGTANLVTGAGRLALTAVML